VTSLDAIACPGAFPTNDAPVLDLSVIEANLKTGDLRIDVLQGWAADGVKTVEAVDAQGGVVGTASVRQNIYGLDLTNMSGLRDDAGSTKRRRRRR
jgi:hypothetical protein